MNNLLAVSITGADDNVDPVQLAELSVDYPFIEWAILNFPEKVGQPRNPTKSWRSLLLNTISADQLAMHLCGEAVFRDILAGDTATLDEISQFGRVQVNISPRVFTQEEIINVYRTILNQAVPVIAQVNESTESIVRTYIETYGVDHYLNYILFDGSRGRGTLPNQWPIPWAVHTCGYAGGLSPDTLPQQFPLILEATQGELFWIDMETGVRTNDEFDLSKVIAVAEFAKPYIIGL